MWIRSVVVLLIFKGSGHDRDQQVLRDQSCDQTPQQHTRHFHTLPLHFFLFIFYFCFSVFCLLWRRENFLDDEDEKMRMRKGVDICGWVCLAEMNKQWIYREKSNDSKYKQVKEYVVSWAPADRIYSLFNLFLLLLYIIFFINNSCFIIDLSMPLFQICIQYNARLVFCLVSHTLIKNKEN